MRRIDPEALDPDSPCEIAGEVEREQPTRAQIPASFDLEQYQAERETPHRLVEERRVEGRARGVAGRQLVVGDPQGPRQVGGSAEQLLVPPVAPTADRLRKRDCWRDRCEELRHRYSPTIRGEHPDGDPAEQPSRDAEATFPDQRDSAEVVAEPTPVGRNVVEPRSDETSDHRPHRDGTHVIAGAGATSLEATTRHRHRRDDPDRDHQPVRSEL